MRILFVSPVGAFFSGAEVSILNLMSYLSQQGHTIINVCPDNEDNKDERYLERLSSNNIKTYQLKQLKWWWDEAPAHVENNKPALAAYYHKNIAEIREIIKIENIELVISNTVNVFQGAIAAACEQIPHYHIIHEFPEGQFAYYKEKLSVIDSLSDKIFAVHGSLKAKLSRYFSDTKLFSFIPYTATANTARNSIQKQRIISIGGIKPEKNQLELIEAYANLNRPDLELLFIGGWENDYKKECDQVIASQDLKNVSFLGYQENPWEFVGEKDLAVYPSRFETFGLAYVEAILNGIPVLAANNPGHLSVYDVFGAGHLYELGNVSDLRNQLETILNQFDLEKKQAIESSLRAHQAYTIEQTATVFIEQLNFDNSYVKKDLADLSSLMGLELSIDILQRIKGEEITLFWSDDIKEFTPLNSQSIPVKIKDSIEIPVTSYKKLRIDLTENPSLFRNVTLKSVSDGQEIIPIDTNAIIRDGEWLFLKNDPQIIYDVNDYLGQVLILSYERCSENSYYERVQNTYDSLIYEASKVEMLNKHLSDLQSEFDCLNLEYHRVVTSRRWTIPTRLINFFRRSK